MAKEANVTIQMASSHLSKLDQGGVLGPRKQGRHQYRVFANDQAAHVPEGLMDCASFGRFEALYWAKRDQTPALFRRS